MVGTPAIDSGFFDDVYLTFDAVGGLGATSGNQAIVNLPSGSVAIGVVVEPLVVWLWAGGLLIGIGGAPGPGPRVSPPGHRPGLGLLGAGDRGSRLVGLFGARTTEPVGAPRRPRGARRDGAPPPPRAAGLAGAVLAALVILGVVLATRTPQEATAISSPLLGRPAPPASGPDLATGAPVSLAAWRGHFVVVNFFASWCIPCQEEAPDLSRFAYEQSHRTGGADMLSVVFDDTLSTRAQLPAE